MTKKPPLKMNKDHNTFLTRELGDFSLRSAPVSDQQRVTRSLERDYWGKKGKKKSTSWLDHSVLFFITIIMDSVSVLHEH